MLIILKEFPRPPGKCQEDKRENNKPTANPHGNHCKNTGVWGHHTQKKQEDTIQILFQNCGGLGDIKREKNSPKLDLLKSFILKQEVDMISLAEVNTNWRKIPTSRNLWTRTDRWFRNRQISLGNNTRFTPESKFQIGGTVTMTVEDVAPRVIETGSDSRSLGRWSWIRTCGKGNLTTRFVT